MMMGLEFDAHEPDDSDPDEAAVNAGETVHLGLNLEEKFRHNTIIMIGDKTLYFKM